MDFIVKPWAHQKKAIDIASKKNYYALFFEMGTGKTLTSINILRSWCLRENRVLNTLILCPPAIISQWGEEINKFSRLGPHVQLLNQNTGAKKKKALQESMNLGGKKIYITNYETLLNKEFFNLLNTLNIECLICDESHKLKSLQAKRTKQVIALSKKTKYRLILTGTPILNSPVDLFSQFLILDKGKSFGTNYFVFRARYFYDANATMPKHSYFPNWKARPNIEEELNSIISESSMRVKKSECLDLPPLVKQKIDVPMTTKQQKAYNDLKHDFIAYLDDKHCVADLALTKLLRMQQVLCGHLPVEDIDGQNQEIKKIDNNRLGALKDIVVNAVDSSKVIIWTTFRETYAEIGDMLDGQRIPYSMIIGGQSASKRQEAIEEFRNNDKVRVCIASQKAGGVGLNLTESNISVYYSRGYSLEDDLQSEARNYRGGSERHSHITRIDLVSKGTVDEVILEALTNKVSLAEKILDYKNKFI